MHVVVEDTYSNFTFNLLFINLTILMKNKQYSYLQWIFSDVVTNNQPDYY
jgi:hypothetical protein